MTDKQIRICLSVTRAPSRCTHALTISNPTPVGFTLSKTQRPGTTYRLCIRARFYIAMFRANLAPNRRRANRGRFMKAPLVVALVSLVRRFLAQLQGAVVIAPLNRAERSRF